ncbi:MAG: hypothetical protein RR609_05620 [Aurantimicrobium sp.]
MQLESALDGFIAYLGAERGYSEHTIKAYSFEILQTTPNEGM